MLTARDIAWHAGDRLILDDVSLDVTPGHMIGLIGPNGSGKTSLLRSIAARRTPTAGTVTLDDQDLRVITTGPPHDVLTAPLIQRVYDVNAIITTHPVTRTPSITFTPRPTDEPQPVDPGARARDRQAEIPGRIAG